MKNNILEPKAPTLKPRKKVAAYARVSMETERLKRSLSAQVSYYSAFIQNNPEWVYAGVYADDSISGTDTERRGEFNRLIADCDAGLVDIVLVKSISRFARNTVDLLETVRRSGRRNGVGRIPNTSAPGNAGFAGTISHTSLSARTAAVTCRRRSNTTWTGPPRSAG